MFDKMLSRYNLTALLAAHKGCRAFIEITNFHLEITISAVYLCFGHQREETSHTN